MCLLSLGNGPRLHQSNPLSRRTEGSWWCQESQEELWLRRRGGWPASGAVLGVPRGSQGPYLVWLVILAPVPAAVPPLVPIFPHSFPAGELSKIPPPPICLRTEVRVLALLPTTANTNTTSTPKAQLSPEMSVSRR